MLDMEKSFFPFYVAFDISFFLSQKEGLLCFTFL